jgi:hypothetical protein
MPRIEHSRPVRPRGRFCAWKLPGWIRCWSGLSWGSALLESRWKLLLARHLSGSLSGLPQVRFWGCCHSSQSISQALNLWPCVARVVCFLDHVLDLGLCRVERVFVDQPGSGLSNLSEALYNSKRPSAAYWRQRSRSACIYAGVIGTKFCAISRFCSRMCISSTPEMVQATGRLMA